MGSSLAISWQYSAQQYDSIQVGNLQHCAIIVIGTVELNLLAGSTLVLHNIRHVPYPELSIALISVGQLDEDDIGDDISWGRCTLHKGNLLLAWGLKVHSLYLLYATLRSGDLFLVDIPMSSLWQGRLAIWAKPTPHTYLEPTIFQNYPSLTTNSTRCASTTIKPQSHTWGPCQESRDSSI